MLNIRSIKDIDIEGKKVFLRCDFNVPLDEFRNISDERRIRSAIPTIRYCLDSGCSVILASHLGRPKGRDESLSLEPVAKRLNRILAPEIIFADDVTGKDAVQKAKDLKKVKFYYWKIYALTKVKLKMMKSLQKSYLIWRKFS